MQRSVAVFLAIAVIYVGAGLLPSAHSALGWLAQGTVISGAIATFCVMQAHHVSVPQAAAVFLCTGSLAALSSLSATTCYLKNEDCTSLMPLHAAVLSNALLLGAASFTAFGVWLALGFPVWLAIFGTVIAAPAMTLAVLPLVSRLIGSLV
jgi:hypothetical protein